MNIHFTVKKREPFTVNVSETPHFLSWRFCIQQNVHNLFDFSTFSFFAGFCGLRRSRNHESVDFIRLHGFTYPQKLELTFAKSA